MNGKFRTSIAPVLSGVAAGLVVVVYYSSNIDNEEQTKTHSLPSKNTTYITTDKDTKLLAKSNQSELSLLKKQLSDLKSENELDKNNSVTILADKTQETTSKYDEQSLEEAQSAELAWWNNINTQFEQEEYDSNWAPGAENNFSQDMHSMAINTGFTLVNTDCRAIRCAVTVEFSSYTQATEKFSDLLHYEYKTNCARQTLLPEPDRSLGNEPYQATFIFDCSDNNLGQVPPMVGACQ